MRRTRVAVLALALLCLGAPWAHAEFDWPLGTQLPEHDIAVGVSGGFAFGDPVGPATMGPSGGVALSYLHGIFGAHLSLSAFPERTGVRLQPLAEVTLWYVALVGVGLSVAPMVGEVPPDASEMAVSLHALVGFPIPLWSHGDVDEPEGTVVLVPFARPGLRIESPGEVRGYHTVGVMLKWTSYGF